MNLFAGRKVYAGKWSVKETRSFNDEELGMVIKAQVVPSDYGKSVCFMMVGGYQQYIPLSNDSTAKTGEILDLTKCQVVTLEKQGEADIVRIHI